QAGVTAIIDHALDLGVTFIDTADVYTQGRSEETLGVALQDRRQQAILGTKVASPVGQGPNDRGASRYRILAGVEVSLRRLRTDYIDLYQIHRWDPLSPIEETLEALHDIVKAGKARYIGASSMNAWQFSKAHYLARMAGLTSFVSMQNHYNLLNREEEREMLPLCADLGVGVIPWSPLARGRLTRDWDEETTRSQTDEFGSNLYRPGDRVIVEQVARIASERLVPRAQVALAWVASRPGITAPIIGATKPQHISDAVAALDLVLTDAELQQLETAYEPHHPAGF
ncbi:MAG TPA: aldo/keto reductase, partial [Propionibacteriaceae bacterium]|nr:aldo/keto reductase [Propionibacteriaceae bacterium]